MRQILPTPSRRAFSEIPQEIDEHALARYFSLTANDRKFIARFRGDHNRLGMACHISWLRWLGWQPDGLKGAPKTATIFLARQLDVSPECLSRYSSHPRPWQSHAEQARKHLGWRAYHSAEAQALSAWLFNEALQYDNARGLLEAAVSFLRREKIVRPGLTTLERVVVTARTQAMERLGQTIDNLLAPQQKKALDALIAPAGPGETSRLQFLKEPPGRPTAKSLLALLDRIETIRELGLETLDLSALNPNRRKVLAREAGRLFPAELRRLEVPRRYALLVCLLSELLRSLNDQAVEMHSQLIQEILNRSEGRRNAELIKRGQVINTHMHLLRQIGQVVLDDSIADAELRPAIYKVVSRARLHQAVKECEALVQPEDYNFLAFVSNSYSYLRQFGPRFLATLTLHTTEGGETLFRAIEYQRRLDSDEQAQFINPPVDFVPYKLRKIISHEDGTVDRRLWEWTLHDRLTRALRAGDIWVEYSAEHAPLSHDLNVTAEAKAAFLKHNPHLNDVEQFLDNHRALHLETLSRVNALWPNLEDVDFVDGRLQLGRLKAEVEPEGTQIARQRIYSLLPRRKLAQVCREVLHWVDYLEPFREVAGGDIRLDDLEQRLLALLMAEGCNIGLANMAQATPGMSYIQVAHVASRCLHDDVIEKAIALVINFYDHLPIARVWGEGIWSSADGQLVPTPVKTLYARLHPRASKGKRVLNLFTMSTTVSCRIGAE